MHVYLYGMCAITYQVYHRTELCQNWDDIDADPTPHIGRGPTVTSPPQVAGKNCLHGCEVNKHFEAEGIAMPNEPHT